MNTHSLADFINNRPDAEAIIVALNELRERDGVRNG